MQVEEWVTGTGDSVFHLNIGKLAEKRFGNIR